MLMGVIGFKQNGRADVKKRADHKPQQISNLYARKVKGAGGKGTQWGHQCENDQARPGNFPAKAGADEQGHQRKGGGQFVEYDTNE